MRLWQSDLQLGRRFWLAGQFSNAKHGNIFGLLNRELGPNVAILAEIQTIHDTLLSRHSITARLPGLSHHTQPHAWNSERL